MASMADTVGALLQLHCHLLTLTFYQSKAELACSLVGARASVTECVRHVDPWAAEGCPGGPWSLAVK